MIVDVPPPRTKSGDLMVESAEIEIIFRDLIEVSVDLINCKSQRGWIHWRYEQELCSDADGECVIDGLDIDDDASATFRSVSELWTADWWRATEMELPGNGSKRILAIGIATDETAITMTGSK